MMLQLDPRYPLVWRSPTSLQLGIDRPVIVLHEVTIAQERMLAALVVGVTEPGFDLIARAAQADDPTARAFLQAVAPALRTRGDRGRDIGAPVRGVTATTVLLTGHGATAEALCNILNTTGLKVRSHDLSHEPQPGDIAVIVDHYVVDPNVRGYWLRRDISHLPVVVSDSTIRIGPFIDPGDGPCLWCLDRTRSEHDPAWPAIASQLLGRRSPVDRGLNAIEAGALAARAVLDRVAGLHRAGNPTHPTAARGVSTTLHVATGARSTQRWTRHPECGCAALPESGSPVVSPSGQQMTPRTRESETVARG